MSRYEIQSILGGFLETDGGTDLGCPTIMGATGTSISGSFRTDFPSEVPSQPCANPIQHVPSPEA
jgi:hypothetical protein